MELTRKLVDITYNSRAAGLTTVNCAYGKFKPLLTKQFPTDIRLTLSSPALKQGRKPGLTLELGTPDTQTNWETRTEVSSKYRKVSVDEVLKMLVNSK